MPTAFAFDLAQLPEALRKHLRSWVEKTAARWAEEDSTLYFARKKPTERRISREAFKLWQRGVGRLICPRATFCATWTLLARPCQWATNQRSTSPWATTTSQNPRRHSLSESLAQTFTGPCRPRFLHQRPRPSRRASIDPFFRQIMANKFVE